MKGKTAVITGCLQGIGRSTLDLFAENNATIFACCQEENQEFSDHIHDISCRYGIEIKPIYFDLKSNQSIKDAAHAIFKSKKTIDILVNVAGMTKDALLSMVTLEQLQEIFQVNFFSQIIFTQYIAKLMLKNRSGSIINISSISALDGNIGQLAYSSSKAAIIGATKTMSAELAPNGIRVNAIAPGVIKTAMTEHIPQEALDRQLVKSKLKKIGLPQEVANAILYLASDMSTYVTGQVMRVDGGIGY